jgi:L-fuconate dehydratase
LGGVNEFLVVLLMAAKKGIPVCPHGGGVGLCEHTQHLSAIDYICISGSLENRYVEYVDHLHEHFDDPIRMKGDRFLLPEKPGYSTKILGPSIEKFAFPNGSYWKGDQPPLHQ